MDLRKAVPGRLPAEAELPDDSQQAGGLPLDVHRLRRRRRGALQQAQCRTAPAEHGNHAHHGKIEFRDPTTRSKPVPGARSEQGAVETPILDVPVYFVEEIGQALDLVAHHPTAQRRRLEISGEAGWIGEVVLVASLVQEIDAQCIGKLHSRPSAPANPAAAEEKEALPGWLDQPRIGLSCI